MHTRLSPGTFARVRGGLSISFLALAMLSGPARGANTLELASCPGKRVGEKPSLSGLFRVHVACDRLLFEIPPAMLDRDMLVYTEFSQVWTTDSDIVPGTAADKRMMRWHRRVFAELASSLGIPFVILDMHADIDRMVSNLHMRKQMQLRDASDAGVEVMQSQLKTREPLTEEELAHTINIDTGKGWNRDEILRQIRARLN